MFNTIRDWLKNLFDNKDDLYQLGSIASDTHVNTVYLPRTVENRFRPFFIHRQQPLWAPLNKHKAKGFTVYIQPGKDDRTVGISIAWCSNKDDFIKKEGRKVAMSKPPIYINPREVPDWIGAQYDHLITGNRVSDGKGLAREYYYVLKYML